MGPLIHHRTITYAYTFRHCIRTSQRYFSTELQLGSQETADGLKEAMETVFEKDGITQIIKDRLVAFVADGASVNLGRKGGLAIKLEEFVGRKLVKVHCLAHRLNLAVRKVLTKDFNWIFHVESAIKQVHTFFYNKGHKRKSILREFIKGVRATFGEIFKPVGQLQRRRP